MFEILTVLILMGILAAIVMSILPGSTVNLTKEADRLSSHLRYAQLRAQSDTYQWRVIFTDTTTYEIGPMVVTGRGFTPGTIPGTDSTEGVLSEGVTTTSGTVIRFDSWGRPLTDFGTLRTTDQTIILTGGGLTQIITIQAETGLIE